MRAAPAVSVVCTGGLTWRLAQAGLPALAAGACAAWMSQHLQGPMVIAPVAAALVACLAWRLAGPVPASLVCDGQRWNCDGVPGFPEVMLDLDMLLVLRWRGSEPARASRWIAVSAGEAARELHGLRAALFAPQPLVLPGDQA